MVKCDIFLAQFDFLKKLTIHGRTRGSAPTSDIRWCFVGAGPCVGSVYSSFVIASERSERGNLKMYRHGANSHCLRLPQLLRSLAMTSVDRCCLHRAGNAHPYERCSVVPTLLIKSITTRGNDRCRVGVHRGRAARLRGNARRSYGKIRTQAAGQRLPLWVFFSPFFLDKQKEWAVGD